MWRARFSDNYGYPIQCHPGHTGTIVLQFWTRSLSPGKLMGSVVRLNISGFIERLGVFRWVSGGS